MPSGIEHGTGATRCPTRANPVVEIVMEARSHSARVPGMLSTCHLSAGKGRPQRTAPREGLSIVRGGRLLLQGTIIVGAL